MITLVVQNYRLIREQSKVGCFASQAKFCNKSLSAIFLSFKTISDNKKIIDSVKRLHYQTL